MLRPTHLEIDLKQIAKNFAILQKQCAPSQMMCVLKANAYGHGLIPVARALVHAGCEYFALAYVDEAILLRKAGFQTPILVLGGITNARIPIFIQHNLTLTASSLDKLRAIEACAQQL